MDKSERSTVVAEIKSKMEKLLPYEAYLKNPCKNSDYFFNPMIFWGGSVDYNIYPNDLKYGDKHTFAIVSTPDPEEVEQNVLSFYVDGVQVGDTKQQNRNAIHNTFYGIVVEGGTSRPMNGTLLSGRFYTRALTVAELAANHANDIAKYGGNT